MFDIENNFLRRLVLLIYTPFSFIILLPLLFLWNIYGLGIKEAMYYLVLEFVHFPKNFMEDWREYPEEPDDLEVDN